MAKPFLWVGKDLGMGWLCQQSAKVQQQILQELRYLKFQLVKRCG
jgi:hypothetical protein